MLFGRIQFDWDDLLILFGGIGLVLALSVALAQWDRCQRRSRGERPPLPCKLLRPAGWSLMQRMDELQASLAQWFMAALGIGVLCVLTLKAIGPIAYQLMVGGFTLAELHRADRGGSSYALVSVTLASCLGLVWALAMVNRRFRELRDHRFGLRGEQAVAEALASPEVVHAGYRAFHDLPGSGDWNIDHVLVGPGGVFVLETKTRSKRKSKSGQPAHEVRYDGQRLWFPWCYDDRAASQAQNNADWIRSLLADFSPKDITVQPVVILPGWWVTSLGNFPVKAMNTKYLRETFLRSAPRLFEPAQLQPVLRRLDEHCRTLEF